MARRKRTITPKSLARMSDETVARHLRELRAQTSRRVYRLRHQGFAESPAVKSAERAGYVNSPTMRAGRRIAKMTRKQMANEIYERQEWLKMQTSTIAGARHVAETVQSVLGEGQIRDLSKDEENEAFRIRDHLAGIYPSLMHRIGDSRHRRNSDQILAEIGLYIQKNLSEEDIENMMIAEMQELADLQSMGRKSRYGWDLKFTNHIPKKGK